VTLISPFVGRISDWFKKSGASWNSADQDPGVLSVKKIYSYLKQHRYATSVMGASFRNVDQVLALAGCDLLTVSPDLLEQLKNDTTRTRLVRQLDPAGGTTSAPPLDLAEAAFRFQLNEDAMASEKLAEGIRAFVADGQKLDARLAC
jgi:transaldolase